MLSDSAVGWEKSAASIASCSTVVIVTAISYLLVLRAFHAEALPTNSSFISMCSFLVTRWLEQSI